MNKAEVLFYCPGGGIGHLNRSISIVRKLLKLNPNLNILICTTSPYVHYVLNENIPIIRFPGIYEAHYIYKDAIIQKFIENINPKLIVVDTFLFGINNELKNYFENINIKKIFIQRDLNLDIPDFYDHIICPYPLQENFSNNKKQIFVGFIVNRDKSEILPKEIALKYLRIKDTNKYTVAIIHNGNYSETTSLFNQILGICKYINLNLRLITLTPIYNPDFSEYLISYYPATELFNAIDLIISGGGYNIVAETEAFEMKALFYPFKRKVDNQFYRLKDKCCFNSTTSPKDLVKIIKERIDQSPLKIISENYIGAQKTAQFIYNSLNNIS